MTPRNPCPECRRWMRQAALNYRAASTSAEAQAWIAMAVDARDRDCRCHATGRRHGPAKAGRVKSAAKAMAARKNGKKGGRKKA